jgi:hypothetical protein
MFFPQLARWAGRLSRRRPRTAPQRAPTFRPRLEPFEDRLVPSTVDHFAVIVPSQSVAGAVLQMQVVAEDACDNVVTDFEGTVHFSSSDGQATIPFDFHFTVADQGVHTFAAILRTAGWQSINVTLVGNDCVSGEGDVLVTHAALDHFAVSAPGSTVAGAPFQFTVTAQDAYGNTIDDYTGTVHFGSSDGQATVPYDFHFTVADQGSHTFAAILRTAGCQTIDVNDVDNPGIAGWAGIAVTHAALDHFAVSAPPYVFQGACFSVTVTAEDAYGNTVDDYTGTVHFGSSDPDASLPDDYTFTEGDGGSATFTAALNTLGKQSISVNDVLDPGVMGTAYVNVLPPPIV